VVARRALSDPLRRHVPDRLRLPLALVEGIFITELEPDDGIRLAVKDLFDTAGVRTTYGSAVFGDHVPEVTAEAVRRLEIAGYSNVGKTNLHEFAYGITSQNLHYGTVPNPAFPGRTAGGSSGGSGAALAAGLADAALGTDSGGSIRIPAACCAVAGLKPTYGLVSTVGVFPLAPSYDHAGPMARDVATCTSLMGALVGLEASEVEAGRLRVGVAWTPLAAPEIGARVEKAAALLAADARPIEFPLPEGTTALFMREVADVHRELYAEQPELYGENIRSKIELCLAVTDEEVSAAASARAAYERDALSALDRLDLLVTPTLGLVPPAADVDEIAVRTSIIRFTYPFNLLGWPALALPCGAVGRVDGGGGLPVSMQLVGRPGTDALVLAAGELLEEALR
jgi:aspartyl-tRNA(Asn)/glutamyl-tRNA(Gln) amidotransferase subunit A